MFAVTSEYEALQVAIQRENQLWLQKNHTIDRMPIVRFLCLFFFLSLSIRLFSKREKYIFLTFERQPRLHSNVGESKYDLFLPNDSERMIDRIRPHAQYASVRIARAVQFLTRLIRYPRYRLSDIYFSDRVENRACCRSTGGRSKMRVKSHRQCRNKGRSPRARTDGNALARAQTCAIGPGLLGHRDKNRRDSKNGDARDGTHMETVRCVIPGRRWTNGRDRETTSRVMEP